MVRYVVGSDITPVWSGISTDQHFVPAASAPMRQGRIESASGRNRGWPPSMRYRNAGLLGNECERQKQCQIHISISAVVEQNPNDGIQPCVCHRTLSLRRWTQSCRSCLLILLTCQPSSRLACSFGQYRQHPGLCTSKQPQSCRRDSATDMAQR